MSLDKQRVLTINCGSSSVKFALFLVDDVLARELYGKIDRVGLKGMNLTFRDLVKNQQGMQNLTITNLKSVADFIINWLKERNIFESIQAVGHRVVHGMKHSESELVTQDLLNELRLISPFDPDHLPQEIEFIEAFYLRYPNLHQVACFDTAFHHDMPRIAKLLPIPRRYEAKGVKRYGFHGLSYSYLMEELSLLNACAGASSKVILAHLGNGSSMAAVLDRKSIDTSMGFSPTSGLPMSTRSGDIDPGLVTYLMRMENMSEAQFHNMVNHESGLLGLSEISSDMRDLLDIESSDVRAAEAIGLFCYQAKKQIGAFTAALGGLDTLVFAGGIGENAWLIRERICDDLGVFGIELNHERNLKNAPLISSDLSRVNVRVICTDEELMIARSVVRFFDLNTNHES